MAIWLLCGSISVSAAALVGGGGGSRLGSDTRSSPVLSEEGVRELGGMRKGTCGLGLAAEGQEPA
jgi:hypothetical protein